jgi:5-methylcytosine-specific restriction protein A
MPLKPMAHGKAKSSSKPSIERPNSYQRGYDRAWARVRLAYLRDNPTCVECARTGLVVAATDVDHVQPLKHGRNDARRLDMDELQSLCHACHSAKTRREQIAGLL